MPASVRPWKELKAVRTSNRPSSWPNLRASLNSPSLASPPLLQKKHLPGPIRLHQRLGQPALRLVIVEIGDVNQLARLLHQRLGDRRVRVAERRHRDAAAQVQITLAGDIVHIAAGAVAEHEIKPAVAGHDVLLEQRLHGRHIIPHNRRRRGHNFFHLFSESFVPIETGITP